MNTAAIYVFAIGGLLTLALLAGALAAHRDEIWRDKDE